MKLGIFHSLSLRMVCHKIADNVGRIAAVVVAEYVKHIKAMKPNSSTKDEATSVCHNRSNTMLAVVLSVGLEFEGIKNLKIKQQ